MFVIVIISKLFFNLSNFCGIICFLTKLLTLGILFFNFIFDAVFVAKLLTSGILFPNSVRFIFSTKSVTLGIFFSNSVLSVWYLVFKTNAPVSILFTFAANLSYTVFFKQHHFLLHHSIYSNQQDLVLIFQCLIFQLQV